MKLQASRTRERWMFLAGLSIWVLLHLVWVFTENVNGDEFILLARARDTYLSGKIQSGGRPGLGSVVLIPFTSNCADALQAVRAARAGWTLFSVFILVGLWLTLHQLLSRRACRDTDTLIGVSLLALSPGFLRYSIQVRTDQPAVGFGMLGAAALLASRTRQIWAAAAGVLFGIGYMFSQKLLYVGVLSALLAAADVVLNDRLQLRREGRRVLLVGLAFVGTILALRGLVSLRFEPAPAIDLGSQMSDFDYYHEVIGYYFYRLLSVELVPHAIVASLAVVGSMKMARDGSPFDRTPQRLAVLICALGLAVAWFHAGRFPYFWITLGLFPAVAAAAAMPAVRKAVANGPGAWLSFRLAVLILLAFAVIEGVYLSVDSQAIQRDSLNFVEENFPSQALGFHPERAHLCRHDPDPLPTFVVQSIARRFEWNPAAGSAKEAFIAEFEERPVQFIIDSHMLHWFPPEVSSFWDDHYVRYAKAVFVPGTAVDSGPGARVSYEVLVPGAYEWRPNVDSWGGQIRVDGVELGAGDTISLERGWHDINSDRGERGLFVLRMSDEPAPGAERFYTGFLPSWVWLGLRLTGS